VRFLPFFLLLLCLDARAQVVSESPRSARERFFVEGSSATVLYKGDRPWKGESGLKGLSDRMGPGMALVLATGGPPRVIFLCHGQQAFSPAS